MPAGLRRFAPLLIAAWTSALYAHLAIDALGDVLLPHDTYDDVAHGSRAMAGAVLGFAVLGLSAASLIARFRAPDVRREAARSRADVLRFVLAAVALAFVALVSMEALDVLNAGDRIDSLSDLLGGDWRLGTSVLVSIALPLACGVWRLVAALDRLPAGLIAGVTRIVRRLRGHGGAALTPHERRRRDRLTLRAHLIVPSLLGRAPPVGRHRRPTPHRS